MSIINDALKKAQADLNKSNEVPAITPEPLPNPAPKKESVVNSSTPGDPVSASTPLSGTELPWTEHPKAPWQITAEPPAAAKSTEPSAQNKKEIRIQPRSSLVYLILILCALTGLSLIFFNKSETLFSKASFKIPKLSLKLPLSKGTTILTSRTAPAEAATGIPQNVSSATTVTVGGIMTNGNQKVALINNKVYAEGDEINGMKILKISFDEVTVTDHGEEKSFRVKGN